MAFQLAAGVLAGQDAVAREPRFTVTPLTGYRVSGDLEAESGTGADITDIDPDTVFAFSIGGGAQLFPDRRVGARLETRALGSVIESDTAVFCGGSGGVTCAVAAKADIFWQWELFAGLVGRF